MGDRKPIGAYAIPNMRWLMSGQHEYEQFFFFADARDAALGNRPCRPYLKPLLPEMSGNVADM